MESQLSTYGKSVTEDKLREEAIRLMEEKERYQVGGVANLIRYLLKQIGSWLSFGQLVGDTKVVLVHALHVPRR